MPPACGTASRRSSTWQSRSEDSERLRALAVCVVARRRRGRRGFFVAKGQVVCVRPFHGAHGVEWQAGLAAVARAEPRPGGRDDRRAARDCRLPAAPAARARGGVPHTPRHGRPPRAWRTGEGWRKLVADGVTATPVTLRRGAAVKLVDGATTEIVPRAEWPARLDAILADARNVHVLSPDGDVTRGAASVDGGSSRMHAPRRPRPSPTRTTARAGTRCRRIIHSSRRRRSRATRSARCSTTSNCCARCRSGSATASGSSTPAAARRT